MKKSAVLLGVLGLVMILAFVGRKQPIDNESPITYVVGDTGPAGGKIFYVNPTAAADGWTYLEAAPTDLIETFKWGAHGKDVGGTKTEVGTGMKNTELIVAYLKTTGETKCAAQMAYDYNYNGYSDWFLPSKDELALMCENLKLNEIGDFSNSLYWSSSQARDNSAWNQLFFNGGQNFYDKSAMNNYVRVVRSF